MMCHDPNGQLTCSSTNNECNAKRSELPAQHSKEIVRRETEQVRRREQLGEDGDSDDEPQQREASRQRSRTKRARDNDDCASTTILVDLMSEDELAAARVAPLAAPVDDTQRRIVDHVRVALSDAVCDEIVLKCESETGRVCELLRARTICFSSEERGTPVHRAQSANDIST